MRSMLLLITITIHDINNIEINFESFDKTIIFLLMCDNSY